MGVTTRFLRKGSELMPYRVRDILVVSSEYDAFVLEEEGNLSEQIFLEYKSLSLSSAPHILHATKNEDALSYLAERRFDLVLIVAREAHEDLIEFGRLIKQIRKDQIVVALGFQSSDHSLLKAMASSDALDSVFVWSGDAKILLAIIKTIEDRTNVDNDIAVAGVRVILVVEDSIRYYSAFLSALYPELMKQSQSLFSEGINRVQKLLRMRTRPKVLHATTYEQAFALFSRYRANVLGIISDLGFPRQGRYDPMAGLELVRQIRAAIPDLPMLLQSAEESHLDEVRALGALFVNKNSTALLHTFREFLHDHLGFGPFVFRLPDGSEVARAKDVLEMARAIQTIPQESLRFHAEANYFSNWLMARSEFELAAWLKPQNVADFESIEGLRTYLAETFEDFFREVRLGAVVDFSRKNFDGESLFQRIGEGSLGGKARGMAFLNHLLNKTVHRGKLEDLRVQIPQTFVLSTDAFELFIEQNRVYQEVGQLKDDRAIVQRCLLGQLGAEAVCALRVIVRHIRGPLAVRSSSLLEDDMFHPFAGIYKTVMIPNNQGSDEERLGELCAAIKVVYASTYFHNARSYLANTGHSVEEERMAILVQRLVGQPHGRRFYPHFSGVAHSYNYYPFGPLRAEDGAVQACLGLGRMVVDGGQTMRFSPRHPLVQPQFATPQLTVKNSQRAFYALDLELPWFDPASQGFDANQVICDLERAVEDGTDRWVCSVYDLENQTIVEGAYARGPRVVTFNNILKHRTIPFAPVMDKLLRVISDGLGTAVEVEFACDMGGLGQPIQEGGEEPGPPTLYLLQVRPIQTRESMGESALKEVDPQQIFCRSSQALGNGRFRDLRDLVFVKPESFSPGLTRTIAAQVGELNHKLLLEKRPYVLMGPGRWGSADHWLGIPVQWSQIEGARIIVEVGVRGFNVDPSQGSHFFHNLTALRLGYMTIPAPVPGRLTREQESFVDWDWLRAQPVVEETAYLRHIRPEKPLLVGIDGRKGLGFLATCEETDGSGDGLDTSHSQ